MSPQPLLISIQEENPSFEPLSHSVSSPLQTQRLLSCLCATQETTDSMPVRSPHTLSPYLWVEAPEMWCTLCWGVWKGASIVCVGWSLIPLRCLLQHNSQALLPFPHLSWALTPGRSTSQSIMRVGLCSKHCSAPPLPALLPAHLSSPPYVYVI